MFLNGSSKFFFRYSDILTSQELRCLGKFFLKFVDPFFFCFFGIKLPDNILLKFLINKASNSL